MADLTDLQAAQSVKIAGANPSTGAETNFLDVDSLGNAKVIATQGTAAANSGAWPVKLTDGTDSSAITTNGDLKVVDGLRNGGVYGALTIPTSGTAVEAKVGASRLANRKFLQITCTTNNIWWGLDSSVTTSTGTPLSNNQTITFAIDPDSTFQVWLVGSSNTRTTRIVECS